MHIVRYAEHDTTSKIRMENIVPNAMADISTGVLPFTNNRIIQIFKRIILSDSMRSNQRLGLCVLIGMVRVATEWTNPPAVGAAAHPSSGWLVR